MTLAQSTMGWRDHVQGPQCWCGPHLEAIQCPQCGRHEVPLYIHRDVILSHDTQPRMTAFSR